jgi:hypothetical protein
MLLSLSLLNRNFTVISDAGAAVGRHEIYCLLKNSSHLKNSIDDCTTLRHLRSHYKNAPTQPYHNSKYGAHLTA